MTNKKLHKMKTRYIIEFKGIFERGAVRLKWITKKKETKVDSRYCLLERATKFRFKWLADFWCWSLNIIDDHLRVYSVKKIEINKK